MNKTPGFAILGCGVIADFHAKAVLGMKNVRLVGACDHDPQRGETFARKYNIRCYPNYEELLKDDEVDAVCICTPNFLHKEGALAALKAGKHVAVEKPMAFTTAETAELKQAVEKSGKVLTSIAQLRFSDDVQRVGKLVKEGAFGQIVFCDLYMKYWRSPTYYAGSYWKGRLAFDGGGALMNQGIHGVDAMLYIMGDATVLSALNQTAYHDIETEDVSISTVRFKNGAVGVIEASTCAFPGFERRLEITGTQGAVVLVENKIKFLSVKGKTLISEQAVETGRTASDPTAMDHFLHQKQLENFVDAILTGAPLTVDVNEGARPVHLIQEIYQKGASAH